MGDRPQHQLNVNIAGASLTLVPHSIESIGARVFVVLDTQEMHSVRNYTTTDLRLLADQLKIAACEAEALERRQQRRRMNTT